MTTGYPNVAYICEGCGTRGLAYRSTRRYCNTTCRARHLYQLGRRTPNPEATLARRRQRWVDERDRANLTKRVDYARQRVRYWQRRTATLERELQAMSRAKEEPMSRPSTILEADA